MNETSPVSLRSETALKNVSSILEFFTHSRWCERFGSPGICDFTIGNPHEMPTPAFVEALGQSLPPKDPYWYAYKMNEDGPRRTVAASLKKWRGISYEPEDIFLTNGATAALSVVLHTIADPGEEVVFVTPSWFLYEAMILNASAVPVRVKAKSDNFDLDLSAIEQALTPKTRAVIINSPNNPTGKVYSDDTLEELAHILTRASRKNGRPVYLISDEAYARIIYDGKTFPDPAGHYEATIAVYTYGKVLLTPGQRIGYIALPPSMPARSRLRKAIFSQQMLNGWAFPNALLQHALPDLDAISIDVAKLQRKRDLVTGALREMGYRVAMPEGAFYCLVESPLADDRIFTEMLADRDVFCIPASLQGADGYFRICLTASDEMIKRALPVFQDVMKQTRQGTVVPGVMPEL